MKVRLKNGYKRKTDLRLSEMLVAAKSTEQPSVFENKTGGSFLFQIIKSLINQNVRVDPYWKKNDWCWRSKNVKRMDCLGCLLRVGPHGLLCQHLVKCSGEVLSGAG